MRGPLRNERFFSLVYAEADEASILPANYGVVASVSGGCDSMVLLAFLIWFRERRQLTVWATQLEHGLRSQAETAADREVVQSFCDEYDVPFIWRSCDVQALARERGKGFEEAGRVARRQLLDDVARRLSEAEPGLLGVRLAYGHHQSDQAESILLHVGRGSGLAGLQGMRRLDGRVIRPLLGVSGEMIRSFARKAGIPGGRTICR